MLQWDLREPNAERACETISTLANGYLGIRGAPENAIRGSRHYPGTYLAGGYNRSVSRAADRQFELTQFVNWPNWLPLQIRPAGGQWLSADSAEVLEYHQQLNITRGVLLRVQRLRDEQGRETSIQAWRIVSMAQRHLGCLRWVVTPHNWSGAVEIRSAIEGDVENHGVPRYEPFQNRQFEVTDRGHDGQSLWLECRSRQSLLYVAMASRTEVRSNDQPTAHRRRCWASESHVEERFETDCVAGEPLTIEKIAATYSSRDTNTLRPLDSARRTVCKAPSATAVRQRHEMTWKQLWQHCEIDAQCEGDLQQALAVNAFHLLQTLSPHTMHLDVGAPARGLHGEEYWGHVFWDQIFLTPFLNLRLPEIPRALLKYRYRRLEAAKQMAGEAGFSGAMFPWRSAAEGREETPPVQLNPRNGRWSADYTYLQRHIGAAVAYNVWQDYQSTHDAAFLESYGAELFLEVCRFWASAVQQDASTGRYHILRVVGPDEYHTAYPDAPRPGIDDNAYTNVMAAWCLRSASCILDLISRQRRSELLDVVQVDEGTLRDWQEIAARIYIPHHEGDIISQFRGYSELRELAWDRYREQYGDIRRIDQILDAEGDSVWRYKVSRQPDVLMMLYLLPFEVLREVFTTAGYHLDRQMVVRNIDYYSRRTSHGSSLSGVVHAWIGMRWGGADAWQRFNETARMDMPRRNLEDGEEGIHLAAMGGTLDLVQRCLIGAEPELEALRLSPCTVPRGVEVAMPLLYCGHWIDIRRNAEQLEVSVREGQRGSVPIRFCGELYRLEPGSRRIFHVDLPG